jgi:hypothetical protein
VFSSITPVWLVIRVSSIPNRFHTYGLGFVGRDDLRALILYIKKNVKDGGGDDSLPLSTSTRARAINRNSWAQARARNGNCWAIAHWARTAHSGRKIARHG